MAQSFTPGLQAKLNHKLTKFRELPLSGQIFVKSGDIVTASQIIGKAEIPGDVVILKIAEGLGIEPFEVIRALKVNIGDEIKEGQLLCEHKGLFGLLKSRFYSKYSGKVDFVSESTAHLGIRLASSFVNLTSYINGQVTEVLDNKTVKIENKCAFVQGIFGVGGERVGILKGLEVRDDANISEKDIPDDVQGKILFGGARADYLALSKAQKLGAVGFITGSIDDKTLKLYLGYDIGLALTGNEDVCMTVIITEGFGELSISKRIIEILRKFAGKETSINGATQVRAGALRPEIIISHDEISDPQAANSHVTGLEEGAEIRIIRVPYFGMKAVVTEMVKEPQKIETGAFTRVLKARLESGKEVVVPRANVELYSA